MKSIITLLAILFAVNVYADCGNCPDGSTVQLPALAGMGACPAGQYAIAINAEDPPTCAAISLTIGTTTISGGTSGRLLYDNAGVLGELSTLSSFESDIESYVDLQDLQGAVTDGQVPDTITINLAATATALAANGSNCSAGSYPLGVDASGAAESCTAIASASDFISFHRWSYCAQSGNGDTTFTCTTTPTVSVTGTGTISSVNGNSLGCTSTACQHRSIMFATAGSSGNNSGHFYGSMTAYSNLLSTLEWGFDFKASIITDTTITSTRIWVGVSSADMTAISTSSTANAIIYYAVGYDTGGAANTANWQACSSDGSSGANTAACTDTNIQVNASTEYEIEVYCAPNQTSTCTMTINGTATNITPKVSTSNTGLGAVYSIRTLTGASRQFAVANWSMLRP